MVSHSVCQLEVTLSRVFLIGQIDGVSYRGAMGSDTTVMLYRLIKRSWVSSLIEMNGGPPILDCGDLVKIHWSLKMLTDL